MNEVVFSFLWRNSNMIYCDYCGCKGNKHDFIHEDFNLNFCDTRCKMYYYIATNKI